jgi:hypothetical protein
MKVKISVVVLFATLLAASLAFGDGFNLVSWPLDVADTAIQPVMADSMGSGVQITGGNVASLSDLVRYYDAATSTWYQAWYRTLGAGNWTGTLTTIEPDKGYFIQIRGTHPAVTLTMTGSVNTGSRTIPIQPGPSENYVGSLFAVDRPLKGTTGDDCGLLASGFTGGNVGSLSDKVRGFDGTTWYTAWYRTLGGGAWKGTLGPGQTIDDPVINPGNGYVIQVLAGHSFTGNQWIYIADPSKGAKTDLSSKTRTIRREISSKVARAQSSSTNKSLAREQRVEEKSSR